MGRRKTWTIENEAYLSENYGIIPILDIAEKLETTELAVEAHARAIGLLTKRSKVQVLQAFAEWGLSHERN